MDVDAAPAQATPHRDGPVKVALAVVVLAAVAGVFALIHSHQSGSSDQSGLIASQIGGTCSKTGFYVQSRLTGSKDTIYDCSTPSKGEMCVTYSGGIASDSTEEVKLLFQNTLGGSRPSCASG